MGDGQLRICSRFFDIAGKTGVELAKVEGAYGLGRNALNEGIRPGPPACAEILSDLIRVNPTKSDQKSDA